MPIAESLELTELEDSYSIVQLDRSAELPLVCFSVQSSTFFSITRSKNELSFICPTQYLDQSELSPIHRSDGWRCLRVELNSDPSEMPGIIASAVNPLAAAELSVFAVASFDTDHILIEKPEPAFSALRQAGHRLNLIADLNPSAKTNTPSLSLKSDQYTADNIPVLDTDRLRLRSFNELDFDHVATFFADPVSALYGGPCDRDTAWRKYATWLGHWTLRGFGPFAIEEKESSTFIGWTGCWSPEGWPEPEITWALLPQFQGKGYANEAAKRAIEFAYQDLGWHTAISVIDNRNSASISLALRLGATAESSVDLFGEPAQLYRHTKR